MSSMDPNVWREEEYHSYNTAVICCHLLDILDSHSQSVICALIAWHVCVPFFNKNSFIGYINVKQSSNGIDVRLWILLASSLWNTLLLAICRLWQDPINSINIYDSGFECISYN
jgi:hypothetical protein